MLMQLGAVAFEVFPVNADEIDHASGASFVQHPVLGDLPPSEFTGEGPEQWRILGRLFPEKFDGALDGMKQLQEMCRSGQSQHLMRGDGTPLGWVAIDHVMDRSRHLDASGVGRVIQFEIVAHKAAAPAAHDVFQSLLPLFTGQSMAQAPAPPSAPYSTPPQTFTFTNGASATF